MRGGNDSTCHLVNSQDILVAELEHFTGVLCSNRKDCNTADLVLIVALLLFSNFGKLK